MRKIFKYNDELFYVMLLVLVLGSYGLDAMNTQNNVYLTVLPLFENLTFLILLLICWGNSNEKKFLVQRVLSTLILLSLLNTVDSIIFLSGTIYYSIFFVLLILNILYTALAYLYGKNN